MFNPTFRNLIPACALLLTGAQAALGQNLPAPAPQPNARPQLRAAAAPTPKAAPEKAVIERDAAEPEGFLLPDPANPNEPKNEPRGDTPPVIILPPPVAPVEPNEVPGATPTPTAEPTPTVAPVATPRPASGASVGGLAINTLSDAAALAKLRHAFAAKARAEVKLTGGPEDYTLRRDELGATIPYAKLIAQARRYKTNVPLRFEVDMARAQSVLARLARSINRTAQPASLDIENGRVVLRGGASMALAVEGSAWRIKTALEAQPPRATVELVIAKAPGSASGEDLSQFRYVLADFSSHYDASLRGRTNNLRLAARNVNGTIVPAGEVFSANKAIGRRDAEAGWQEAKMFVSGQVVTGVGAGICQCASSLYNAALLAGLEIVERHPHQFRVTYVPASRDATLYWGSKDFKFRNTTGGPIYVQTFLRDGRFHARLYGTEAPPANVEIRSRTLSRRGGERSEAYRIIPTPTGARRELLSRDFYMPHP